MTSSSTSAVDSQIQQLKQNWKQLSDLDRARAVLEIKTAGVSGRSLAPILSQRESSLRRLLTALEAPPQDLALARDGKISTNELVRRAQAAKSQRAQQLLQREAEKGADLISSWLRTTNLHGPSCEMILNEVRRELAERTDTLPSRPASIGLPVDEILRRSKPPAFNDDIDITAWYAQWLFRWSFYAFPNYETQSEALDIALSRVEKNR
jgi:hypothetical protein